MRRPTTRRLGTLQWVGLLAGAAIWAAQHIVGFGVTQAECGVGGRHWGISNDAWQGGLMGVAVACVLAAEAAALTVLRSTRETTYESEPPLSRIRFFAIAAVAANAIFVMIILLDGAASIFHVPCRQG
jgi:hypothetical protein